MLQQHFVVRVNNVIFCGYLGQGSYVIANVRPFVCLFDREQVASDFHETL